MNGVIIQQINLSDLELSIRSIIREELSSINLSKNILKPPEPLDDPLLSKGEAAKLLTVSLPTFSKMIKDGRIKPYKVGRRFKFKKNQILSSLNTK